MVLIVAAIGSVGAGECLGPAGARAVSAAAPSERRDCLGFDRTGARSISSVRGSQRRGQELLGHASVATTQIYTHVSIGQLKETLQRCHPRERGNLEAKDKDDDPDGRRDS